MRLSLTQIERAAAASGFQAEPLERVLQLMSLLEGIRSHPYLKDRLALKGGTALNLFILDLPRLSVDIDLNYIGSGDRETMLAERSKLEQALAAVCSREGIQVRRAPAEHAGGKWRLKYERAAGGSGSLELDLNFLLRTPLWPCTPLDSLPVASVVARQIPVLDVHELAAGKLAALFARDTSRDIFDVHALFARGGFDADKLRLGFVLYGAMNRRDWRTVSVDDVRMDPVDAQQRLLPLLREDVMPRGADVEAWSARLVNECRHGLAAVLPLAAREMEFLSRLNDDGRVAPELLTDDPGMQDRIRTHPGIAWKAVNAGRWAAEKRGESVEREPGH